MMQGIDKIVPVLFIGLLSCYLSGCNDAMEDYNRYKAQNDIAEKTPDFDPTYYKDTKRRHMAVFFDVQDGELKLSARPVQVRVGNMPYKPESAGNVKIVYKNAEGKTLGNYNVYDPILARSCDEQKGGLKGEFKKITKGTIEVLLPLNQQISQIEIIAADDKRKSFNVGERVKKGMKENAENADNALK